MLEKPTVAPLIITAPHFDGALLKITGAKIIGSYHIQLLLELQHRKH